MITFECGYPYYFQAVCKCYTLLTRIGGGGVGGTKHTEAWDQCCVKFVNTGHLILEQLYQDVETGNEGMGVKINVCLINDDLLCGPNLT